MLRRLGPDDGAAMRGGTMCHVVEHLFLPRCPRGGIARLLFEYARALVQSIAGLSCNGVIAKRVMQKPQGWRGAGCRSSLLP